MANNYSGEIIYELDGQFLDLAVPYCPTIEALATYARALQHYTVAKFVSIAWINSTVITQEGASEDGYNDIDDKARVQIARQLTAGKEYRQIVVPCPVLSLFDKDTKTVLKTKGEALVSLYNNMTGRTYYFRSGKYSQAASGVMA